MGDNMSEVKKTHVKGSVDKNGVYRSPHMANRRTSNSSGYTKNENSDGHSRRSPSDIKTLAESQQAGNSGYSKSDTGYGAVMSNTQSASTTSKEVLETELAALHEQAKNASDPTSGEFYDLLAKIEDVERRIKEVDFLNKYGVQGQRSK